ncbi:S26 family signal peptidase [Sphingobium aquiterrae]|uniref:S26 family signal peptidase n=1 Tax=Sphingobium aquiterrae TaxID=2038656 RepID=UPI003015B9A9
MTRRRYIAATFVAGTSALIVACIDPAPRIAWNATPSAPVGLYRVSPGGTGAIGDLVLSMPEPALGQWLARRHYVPLGVPLIKPVAATSGQKVCRAGAIISIDGRPVARAHLRDRVGRPLPQWRGCRTIGAGEVLLLNPRVDDSLDGRYFGPTPAPRVIGTVTPLLTRAHPGASLAWQGWRP